MCSYINHNVVLLGVDIQDLFNLRVCLFLRQSQHSGNGIVSLHHYVMARCLKDDSTESQEHYK